MGKFSHKNFVDFFVVGLNREIILTANCVAVVQTSDYVAIMRNSPFEVYLVSPSSCLWMISSLGQVLLLEELWLSMENKPYSYAQIICGKALSSIFNLPPA